LSVQFICPCSGNCWFFVGLVFFLAPYIFWLLIPCQMYSWQRFFFSFCRLPRQSNNYFLCYAKGFWFHSVPLSIFSLNCWIIRVLFIVITYAYIPFSCDLKMFSFFGTCPILASGASISQAPQGEWCVNKVIYLLTKAGLASNLVLFIL
jgi:hypothetical protein